MFRSSTVKVLAAVAAALAFGTACTSTGAGGSCPSGIEYRVASGPSMAAYSSGLVSHGWLSNALLAQRSYVPARGATHTARPGTIAVIPGTHKLRYTGR